MTSQPPPIALPGPAPRVREDGADARVACASRCFSRAAAGSVRPGCRARRLRFRVRRDAAGYPRPRHRRRRPDRPAQPRPPRRGRCGGEQRRRRRHPDADPRRVPAGRRRRRAAARRPVRDRHGVPTAGRRGARRRGARRRGDGGRGEARRAGVARRAGDGRPGRPDRALVHAGVPPARRGGPVARARRHRPGPPGVPPAQARRARARRVLRLAVGPHAVLQGHAHHRPAGAVLRGPLGPPVRLRDRAGALAVLHQHVPVLAAGAAVPVDRPQRRDQHGARQPQLGRGARGDPAVGPAGRPGPAAAGVHAGRLGLGLVRRGPRAAAPGRPLPAARDHDDDPGGLGEPRADGPRATGVRKGRLEPGKMFLVDTNQGRIVEDDEIKAQLAAQRPYAEWVRENSVYLEQLPEREHIAHSSASVRRRQRTFGYTEEELKILLTPMGASGAEPLGAMGSDTPVAVLSQRPRLLFDYFTQMFAQVTNPPLDAIREELVTSIGGAIGPEPNLLDDTPLHARKLVLPFPVLDNDGLAKIVRIDKDPAMAGVFRSTIVRGLYRAAGGGEALEQRLEEIFAECDQAIADGVSFLVLSDRASDADRAPIPSLLLLSAVHHHLLRRHTRTQVSLVVEAGDVREVHHVALLIGYGAAAVNPYLAMETVEDLAAN